MPEPRNYKEALESEFALFWEAAIAKELKNLADHDIWEWVDLP